MKRIKKPVNCVQEYLLKRGDLKEIFINCAVDEALTRSIWKTNSKNKMGRQLERLRLWAREGGDYGWGWESSAVGSIA